MVDRSSKQPSSSAAAAEEDGGEVELSVGFELSDHRSEWHFVVGSCLLPRRTE